MLKSCAIVLQLQLTQFDDNIFRADYNIINETFSITSKRQEVIKIGRKYFTSIQPHDACFKLREPRLNLL